MRFGLVGTGPWAHMTHGPGLSAAPGVELVGVWGRDPKKAGDLAAKHAVAAYDDYDALLADVDAVAFSVPPNVQATMALTAARAGKHLLLDKPVALGADAARELRDAASAAGVASVVFFTDRFVETSRAWFEHVRTTDGWRGGWLRWFSALQEPDNPYGASPWRHEQGALWDTGPHALSTMSGALGPVVSLEAAGGDGDFVVLVLHHESGATSNVQLTQFAPRAAAGFAAKVWGDEGILPMPPRPADTALSDLLASAAGELVRAAESGQAHALDLVFGTHVVELLADAQAQIRGSSVR